MTRYSLTIGMACYDDFHGVWFTLTSLLTHHLADNRDQLEFIVVDNHPQSEEGRTTQQFVNRLPSNVRYLAYDERVGTAAPRDFVMAEANGRFVMVIDSHVLLHSGAIVRLLDYLNRHADSSDLLSGPLVTEDGQRFFTHMEDRWQAGMWGTWAKDCRGADQDADAFEIPAMGLGLYVCRKEAWPGFHPQFAGFGGEEWYVHEKVRRAGGRCLCLPFLRWSHRFDRPGGPKYPADYPARVRNYLLGHLELDLPIDPIYDHFVGDGLLNEATWMQLKQMVGLADDSRPRREPSQGLEALLHEALQTPGTCHEHLPKIRQLARGCDSVMEIGPGRGATTVALLAGQPERMTCVSLGTHPQLARLVDLEGRTNLTHAQDSPLDLETQTEFLLIGSKVKVEDVVERLQRYASQTTRWIGLLGTAETDPCPRMTALENFLRQNLGWSVIYDALHNNGFTVIGRQQRDKYSGTDRRRQMAAKSEYQLRRLLRIRRRPQQSLDRADTNGSESKLRISRCAGCLYRVDDRCALSGLTLDQLGSEFGWCPVGRFDVVEPRRPPRRCVIPPRNLNQEVDVGVSAKHSDSPELKLLIGALSANGYEDRRNGVRSSWGQIARQRDDVDLVFLVGDPNLSQPRRDGDMLFLPCPDVYECLPQKTYWFCRWALEQGGHWHRLLKCDDDTYVHLDRLLTSEFAPTAIIGAADGDGDHFHGGAGYLISREAAAVIGSDMTQSFGLEDWLARDTIWQSGLEFTDDRRFCFDTSRIPTETNQQISAHYCSSILMRQLHRSLYPKEHGCIPCVVHQIWESGAGCKMPEDVLAAFPANWTFKQWSVADFHALTCDRWKDVRLDAESLTHVARYEVLHAQGGVFLERGFASALGHPSLMQELKNELAVAFAESDQNLGISILACEPNEPLLPELLAAIRAGSSFLEPDKRSGASLFTKHALRYPHWRFGGREVLSRLAKCRLNMDRNRDN